MGRRKGKANKRIFCKGKKEGVPALNEIGGKKKKKRERKISSSSGKDCLAQTAKFDSVERRSEKGRLETKDKESSASA